VQAQVMVTHATSYDILIGEWCYNPYGLLWIFQRKLNIKNWDGKQELIVIKKSLSMKCIKGQVGKSNKSTMLVKFASLPHEFQFIQG
jgi:hypothetical protein